MKFGEEEEVETKDYVPDSLNMRVVGMWPFGQGQAIEGSGDTVYVIFFVLFNIALLPDVLGIYDVRR